MFCNMLYYIALSSLCCMSPILLLVLLFYCFSYYDIFKNIYDIFIKKIALYICVLYRIHICIIMIYVILFFILNLHSTILYWCVYYNIIRYFFVLNMSYFFPFWHHVMLYHTVFILFYVVSYWYVSYNICIILYVGFSLRVVILNNTILICIDRVLNLFLLNLFLCLNIVETHRSKGDCHWREYQ